MSNNKDGYTNDNQNIRRLCSYFSEFVNPLTVEKAIEKVRQDNRFSCDFQEKYFSREKHIFGDLSSFVIDFDIANTFSMNYWYNNKIAGSESSNNLNIFDNAINQCFQQIEVRDLLSDTEKSLPYNRISILFYMRCLINKMNEYLKKWFSENGEGIEENKFMLFHYNSYFKIVKTAQSILNLISSGDMENALPLLRSIIEEYFTYIAINDDEIGLNEYYAIMDAKAEYCNNQRISDATKTRADALHLSPVKYSDLGWLKAMADELGISVVLNFEGLLEFCNKKYSNENNKNPIQISYWKDIHFTCSDFSHSNQLFYSDTIASINAIAVPLSLLTRNLAKRFQIFFNDIDFVFNGVDLQNRLDSECDRLFPSNEEGDSFTINY